MHDVLASMQTALVDARDCISKLDSLQDRPSYCHLEYLSLNREFVGRRILLAGWYGAINCGDELMMRMMLWIGLQD